MIKPELKDITVRKAYATFLFPFAFQVKRQKELMKELQDDGFILFNIEDKELQDKFYGKGVEIVHEELDQYFLPYIEDKLFPSTKERRGFLRYSKEFKEELVWYRKKEKMIFHVNSMDITLCPFGIGIVTVRVELKDEIYSLSGVLDFISHFRVLEPKLKEEKDNRILAEEREMATTHELIMEHLFNPLKSFIIKNNKLTGYYGSLPFFEDERMLSSAFIIADDQEEITSEHLYRISRLDGKTLEGEPYISSNNIEYIEHYVKERTYYRWAPFTYQIFSENSQMTISIKDREELEQEIATFMSTHYYNLLLHYYYKIMLLRLSFEHSELTWVKDREYVKELTERISKFYSRYFFGEVSSRSEGKEISALLRKSFQLDSLFGEVSNTVNDLYRAQSNQTNARQNALLFMLTVYTVISGIYGMNLVIEDWKDLTDWSQVPGYSFFEWVALITAISGIGIAVILLFISGWSGARSKYRKWKRSRQI